jgi:Activator of Hsp90 ATPase homolog 1-like protein
MVKQFDVRWEGDLVGTPEQVWDAFTLHTDGWYWKIRYEPRVGGTETGLTEGGGLVTVWEPGRHFATRADGDGGFFNELDYRLEPRGGGTRLSFSHQGVWADDEYDVKLDMCRQHTPFYYHSLTEYLRHFAGRPAVYVGMDAPASSARDGFAALRTALGVPEHAAVGEEITLTPKGVDPITGVVDYATGSFLGIRTPDALYRLFGRDTWSRPVGVAMHLYAEGIDEAATRALWDSYLSDVFDSEVTR